ncbi:glycosyltransferase [Clostridium sp. E02]|uniref:glycosyltransferase n=1 Tax=Clostridium sp. E02 TaxID=2487134 RepID=UPI000F523463|nr:glycosyltransferase [Clostridium sp. E02]
MRVAWFTPFNIESAIGRYSKFATAVLKRYADVDIFVCQNGNLHDTDCNIVNYTVENAGESLKKYDIAVYNIGDNAIYHSEIYFVLKKYPGIIINHDVCLHNLLRGYYLEYKKDINGFKALLKSTYGETEVKEVWNAAFYPEKFDKLNLLKYNLSEHIGDNALGMIVHSQYHEKYMSNNFKGSMAVIPLLNMSDELEQLDKGIKFNGYSNSKIHILTVGNLNNNKRIHSIISVLGENPILAEKFDYTIIGSQDNISYFGKLKQLINKYKLNDQVKMLGFVNHKELAYYYQRADIISNLRFPAYEGASASIQEQMVIGKPCIVTNTGVYAEYPDDCLIKININNEMQELTRTFFDIIEEHIIIENIGKNAKEFASKHFDRNLYASRVYEFLKQVIFTRPIYGVKDKCIQVISDMPSVYMTGLPRRIAVEIDDLYN